jgi:hypothetical protein
MPPVGALVARVAPLATGSTRLPTRRRGRECPVGVGEQIGEFVLADEPVRRPDLDPSRYRRRDARLRQSALQGDNRQPDN